MQSIYEQLSAYGLIGELHKRVATIRPKVSRNTILLAFDDTTTPLRKRIVQLAEELLAEHEAKTAQIEKAVSVLLDAMYADATKNSSVQTE